MQHSSTLIRQIRQELYEGLKTAGPHRSPFTRRLAHRYYRTYLRQNPSAVIQCSEDLLKSKDTWQHMLACAWLGSSFDQLSPLPFKIFERWLEQYIFSWGTCDDFCKRVLNPLWERDHEVFSQVQKWTQSPNKWVRRASAVIFIKSENGGYASTTPTRYIFDIATRLMADKDIHVQKGYGWMLKASSIHHQRQVYDFVMRNRDIMPRTAFRYAIEKMPAEFRMKAMEK